MICLLTYRVFYKAVLAWLGSALLVCYLLQNKRCRFVLLLKLLLTPVSRTPSSVTQTQTQNSYKYTNIHTYIPFTYYINSFGTDNSAGPDNGWNMTTVYDKPVTVNIDKVAYSRQFELQPALQQLTYVNM